MKGNKYQQKKYIAISFLRLASFGNVREAYEKYVHPDFRHHNPYFPSDRASLLAGMEESAVKFPNKEFEAVRAFEDGDLVAVHGRVTGSLLIEDIPLYTHPLMAGDNGTHSASENVMCFLSEQGKSRINKLPLQRSA